MRANYREHRPVRDAAFGLVLAMCANTAIVAQERAPDTLLSSAHERWRQALIERDWKALGDLFTDDGLVLMLGAPDVRGRAALIAFAQQVLADQAVTELTVTSEVVQMLGDSVASEVGTYHETIKPTSDKPFRLRGHYVALWRRGADHFWRIDRFIQQVERQP